MLERSPDLRHRLGEAGYQRARQFFDWEKKIDRIIELYNLALESG
jgi:glycosyltransferase involved in cell wall biosynthesis